MYICKLCEYQSDTLKGIEIHSRLLHKLTSKEYYDKYLIGTEESKCYLCKAPTKYINISKGYHKYCSTKCSNNSLAVINKKKHTLKNNYGVDSPIKCQSIMDKIQNTCLKRYGVINPSKLKKIKLKKIKNCQENYGVDNPSQCRSIHSKKLKTAYSKHEYILPSNKRIMLQGYESHFLDYVFNNKLYKEEDFDFFGITFEYFDENNKKRVYFPDFYIPHDKLVIEIKSDFTEKLDKNIELKRNAVVSKGFKYIRIVDNNFSNFVL